ncbi:hypothetical protein [Bradyrhizobium septentrionale]|uniref:Extensin n=1 Tax=Bradyrhizobium septentrionale TaxID=1404411 RepID=A0ABZ2P4K9_9BRAD|nr:hypothetical protein [Bradyrhizobium septentrionale]UGY26335.1 hypothetical protein HU675_0006030 [Bradyrhizobium septentrionale]
MLSYLKKFVMDILPSVAATIIGAYIVNHYIVARPEAPAAAAVTAAVDPKADPKAAAKPAEKSTVVSSLPEAGVKAKGMSERTLIERSASEKATVTEKPAEPKSTDPKAADSKPDAPADTASILADSRHRPVAPKAVAKAAPAAAPQLSAPATSAAPAEAAVTPEENRDANDLARAAIERLRKERPQDAARSQDAARTDLARLPDQQRPAAASAIRPLPPPIMVSNPSGENADQSSQPRPPYAASAQDSNRLTPPADIPVPVLQAPLDLRADAAMPAPKNERTSERSSVTDDVFSGMKSMFHAVLPK